MTERPPLADGLHAVAPGKLACVVTSLHMLQAPMLAASASRDDVRLRHMTEPPLDWYRDLFKRIGVSWLWSSRLLLSDAALAAIVGHPDVEVHALQQGSVDIGLVELDFRVAGACEIAFLGLVPEALGRGIGPWLMDRTLRLAWARPITRLWVHTCTLDHPSALGFYRRSGFVPYQTAVEIMEDPRLTGLLPPDAAPHVPLLKINFQLEEIR